MVETPLSNSSYLFSFNPQDIIVFITIFNTTTIKMGLQFFYIFIRIINKGNTYLQLVQDKSKSHFLIDIYHAKALVV